MKGYSRSRPLPAIFLRFAVAHVNQLAAFASGGAGGTAAVRSVIVGISIRQLIVMMLAVNTVVVQMVIRLVGLVEEPVHGKVIWLAGGCFGGWSPVCVEEAVEGGVLTTHDQWQGNSGWRGGVVTWLLLGMMWRMMLGWN